MVILNGEFVVGSDSPDVIVTDGIANLIVAIEIKEKSITKNIGLNLPLPLVPNQLAIAFFFTADPHNAISTLSCLLSLLCKNFFIQILSHPIDISLSALYL